MITDSFERVRFKAVTAVTMESIFCRVVTPCSSERARRLSLPPFYVGFIIGLLSDPEYGGGIFLRNVGLSLN
jgi:hypothetical protein